jgi:hypothetical protein
MLVSATSASQVKLVTALCGVGGVLALAFPSSNSRQGPPFLLGTDNVVPNAATSRFTRFNDPTFVAPNDGRELALSEHSTEPR